MNFDSYRNLMDAAHREFSDRVTDMLLAYGKTQEVFGDALREIDARMTTMDARMTEMSENDAVLKRLILEQGAELRALRERLG